MPSRPYSGSSGHGDQRQIARHELSAYLQLYNAYSGQPMGFIGNISPLGMMMISSMPVMVEAVFDMQIRLPAQTGEAETLSFKARSHWCRPDLTPGHFDTGFSIVSNQQAFAEIARLLEHYFRFEPTDDA